MQHSSRRLFSKALKATAMLAVGCVGLALAPAFAAASALMPKPEALSETGQPVPIGDNWKIVWRAYRDPLLDRAAARFLDRLRMRTGLSIISDETRPQQTLEIDCTGRDAHWLEVSSDDRYQLVVEPGRVRLTAVTSTGVLRGLATLIQLVEPAPEGLQFAGARIEDRPRYAWRGVMIDTARHFMPLDALKRQIDAMELVKLNVLHLHLSDNEGFRVESKLFPEFQKTSDGYYTQAEMRDMIDYAADHGVRVVPEFDAPGHARSWLKAYPQLGPGVKPTPGATPMNDTLDPSREEVYAFVSKLYGEMSRLFADRYFHVGGDEVNGADWDASAAVRQFRTTHGLADNQALQAYFTDRLRKILAGDGKIMVGWDELLRPDLGQSVVVQSWRSSKMTALAARAGHPALSAGGYYLDRLLPAGSMYRTDPIDPVGYGFSEVDWAQMEQTPFKVFFSKEAWVVDDGLRLTPAGQERVLGGEVVMWTELVTSEMIDGRVWPRTAAIAERLWSPAATTDVADMYRRLIVVDGELALFGLHQHANQARMLERLEAEPDPAVARFISLVEPVKNGAHWKLLRSGFQEPMTQQFNTLADVAAPDSLAARRLEAQVRAFLVAPSADNPATEALKAELRTWRDDHRAFAAAAERAPVLKGALPISADISAQAAAGLEAMDAIIGRRAPTAAWKAQQDELLRRDEGWARASASVLGAMTSPQPPADLVIATTPAIRTLVARASASPPAQP